MEEGLKSRRLEHGIPIERDCLQRERISSFV